MCGFSIPVDAINVRQVPVACDIYTGLCEYITIPVSPNTKKYRATVSEQDIYCYHVDGEIYGYHDGVNKISPH